MVKGLTTLAQEPAQLYAKNLDTRHGLPSSTAYYLFQDSKGFIWMATDKGVAKYNGYDFECYANQEGLTNNNVFAITEDPKTGYIWFNAFKGGFCYYNGEHILPHPLNEKIKQKLGKNWASSFGIDSLGNFWFTSSNREYLTLDYNFYKIPPSNDTIIAIAPSETNCIALSGINYVKHCSPSSVLLAGTIGRLKKVPSVVPRGLLPQLEDSFLRSGIRKAIQLKNNLLLVNNLQEWLLFDKDSIHHFDNALGKKADIHQFCQTSDQTIFICTDNGVVQLDKDYQPLDRFLQGFPISHALQDRDGNYWFSTLNSGVFVVASLELKQYLLDQAISKIELGNDSSIWVSTHNRVLYQFVYDSSAGAFVGNRVLPKNKKAEGQQPNWKGAKDQLLLHFLKEPRLIKGLGWTNNNCLMLGAANGFSIYDGKTKQPIFNSNQQGFNKWVKAIMQDEHQQYWIGASDGLYLMSSLDTEPIYMGNLAEKLQRSIHDIAQTSTNQVLVATDGGGLVILKDQEVFSLSQKEGLSSNFINTIWVEHDSSVWIGTNQGMNHLLGDLRKPKIEYYNTENGFPVNDIRIIKKVKDHLLVGGNKGMIVLKKRLENKKAAYTTYLHHIEVNNQAIKQQTDYNFKWDENNLTFHFRTIRFNQHNEYYYRLVGLDTVWQKGNSNMIRYHKLPYGDYVFEAKVKNSPVLRVPFFIHPAFTQTWIFKALIISLCLGIALGLMVIIFRYLSQRTRLKRRMSDLENKALRSQMNPHFIFNAMNSIMFLIVNKDAKSARRYLSQFSKLMRFVLENSKHNFISLTDEIATLQAYLDLEQLRYGSQINILQKIGEDLICNKYKIPPMLIQPILENALMHGLGPKKGQGNLSLEFLKKDNGFCVIIKDDGIGRVAAQKIIKNKTIDAETSSAIKNIEERIQNINIIYQTTLSFQIEDLYQEGKACGTKVVFYIPQIDHEEHTSSNY